MPFEGELTSLAEAAAVALVTAMGTNAWTSVRDATARVFRRGGTKAHDKVADRLDDDASLVAAAGDPPMKRAALEPFWRLEFRELVNAAPECAPISPRSSGCTTRSPGRLPERIWSSTLPCGTSAGRSWRRAVT